MNRKLPHSLMDVEHKFNALTVHDFSLLESLEIDLVDVLNWRNWKTALFFSAAVHTLDDDDEWKMTLLGEIDAVYLLMRKRIDLNSLILHRCCRWHTDLTHISAKKASLFVSTSTLIFIIRNILWMIWAFNSRLLPFTSLSIKWWDHLNKFWIACARDYIIILYISCLEQRLLLTEMKNRS